VITRPVGKTGATNVGNGFAAYLASGQGENYREPSDSDVGLAEKGLSGFV